MTVSLVLSMFDSVEIPSKTILHVKAVFAAQLVERSLPTPEVRGLNPVIGKIYIFNIYCQLYRKDENKWKRGREWPIFEK